MQENGEIQIDSNSGCVKFSDMDDRDMRYIDGGGPPTSNQLRLDRRGRAKRSVTNFDNIAQGYGQISAQI